MPGRDSSRNFFLSTWNFFLKASESDTQSVFTLLKRDGLIEDSGGDSPRDLLAALFTKRYGSADPVPYKRFISDLCDDLELVPQDVRLDLTGKEDRLLVHILTLSVKNCSNKELEELRQQVGLVNRDREGMIKELEVKAATSVNFQKILPILSSMSVGAGIGLASAVATGALFLFPALGFLGAATAIGGIIGSGVGIFSSAGKTFFVNKKKKTALHVLPSMTVIIRIRRESEKSFANKEEVLAYVDSVIKANSNRARRSDLAYFILYHILREENKHLDIQVLETNDHPSLIPLCDFFPEKVFRTLVPFFPSIKPFLLSIIEKDNRYYVPAKTKQAICTESEEHARSDSSAEKDQLSFSRENGTSELEEQVASLTSQVERLERILHGIRHNLAPDFANALHPYRFFLAKPEYPITQEEAQSAVDIGNRIVSILEQAGKEEFGPSETVDLIKELQTEFRDEPYEVTYDASNPSSALISFNKNVLDTCVLNNVKKNLREHAFGLFLSGQVSKDGLVVSMSVDDGGDYWILRINNNGMPIPDRADLRRIWDFGQSFGSKSAGSGTGLFYLKEAVLHYGGKVDIVRNPEIGFSVGYVMEFEKQ